MSPKVMFFLGLLAVIVGTNTSEGKIDGKDKIYRTVRELIGETAQNILEKQFKVEVLPSHDLLYRFKATPEMQNDLENYLNEGRFLFAIEDPAVKTIKTM